MSVEYDEIRTKIEYNKLIAERNYKITQKMMKLSGAILLIGGLTISTLLMISNPVDSKTSVEDCNHCESYEDQSEFSIAENFEQNDGYQLKMTLKKS